MKPEAHIGRSVHVPESFCPMCRHPLDGATIVKESRVLDPNPNEGDYSVCLFCGTVLRFGADMQMRLANEQDLRELKENQPTTFALFERMIQVAHQVVRDRRGLKDILQ